MLIRHLSIGKNGSERDLGWHSTSQVDAKTIIFGPQHKHTRLRRCWLALILRSPDATLLANALKPNAKYAAVVGSYGWDASVSMTFASSYRASSSSFSRQSSARAVEIANRRLN